RLPEAILHRRDLQVFRPRLGRSLDVVRGAEFERIVLADEQAGGEHGRPEQIAEEPDGVDPLHVAHVRRLLSSSPAVGVSEFLATRPATRRYAVTVRSVEESGLRVPRRN